MLVERQGERLFASWCDDPPAHFHQTRESFALLHDAGDLPLLIVAGRQVVTAEGVELLLLGTSACPKDGTPIEDILHDHGGNAVTILPWGFGKWIGQRGALVRAALKGQSALMAGDIQTRPQALPSPILRWSNRAGRPILAGTDILPMESDWKRIGSFGQVLHTRIDPDAPGTSMLAALLMPGSRVYGTRASLTGAVRQQWDWHRQRRRVA